MKKPPFSYFKNNLGIFYVIIGKVFKEGIEWKKI